MHRVGPAVGGARVTRASHALVGAVVVVIPTVPKSQTYITVLIIILKTTSLKNEDVLTQKV